MLLFAACRNENVEQEETKKETFTLQEVPTANKEIILKDYSNAPFRLRDYIDLKKGIISPEDSVKITQIFAYSNAIDEDKGLPILQFIPKEKNEEGIVNLTFNNKQIVKGLYSERSDTLILTRIFYFNENNEILYYRLRKWLRTLDNNNAEEVFFFFENGVPYKAFARAMDLKGDELPALLKSTKLNKSEKDLKAFHDEIKVLWHDIMRMAVETEKENSRME